MKFTIRDLEALSGVKAHTIRIWEQRYALLKPQRTDTNIRYYDGNELKNLLNISLLNKNGYKISHITNFTDELIKEKILQLNTTEAVLERIITDLINTMIDYDIKGFESVINKHIAQKGIDRTVTQILFPFLEKVGVLWQTHSINPAQEHLVTNIIRQKLIVAIDAALPIVNSNKKVIIFTPEGEYHELGILYVQYQMKVRGVNTIYLGVNVPVADTKELINLVKPDYLYSHSTSMQQTNGFAKFINLCKIHIPSNQSIVLSGYLAQNYSGPVPSNVNIKKSMAEVNFFINELT
jgi:MerR family transcriptional regulator, light-induced transcriptional regulator